MSWESSADYYRLANELVRQRLSGLHVWIPLLLIGARRRRGTCLPHGRLHVEAVVDRAPAC